MRSLLLLAALGIASLTAACGQPSEEGARGRASEPLVVAAASSLTDVMEDIAGRFAAEAGLALDLRFGATPDLVRQIENGAMIDVFISADTEWMDYAEARDLTEPGLTRILAGNRLVLIAPASRPFSLLLEPGMNLAGQLDGGRLAIANPDGAPAGRYARQALSRLGVWEQMESSLARAQSVRDALRLVASGAAAAGVVYETDALAAGPEVVLVGRFPEDLHAPIVYPAAALSGGRVAEAARFLDFLVSDKAKAVFERYGFLAAAPAAAAPVLPAL